MRLLATSAPVSVDVTFFEDQPYHGATPLSNSSTMVVILLPKPNTMERPLSVPTRRCSNPTESVITLIAQHNNHVQEASIPSPILFLVPTLVMFTLCLCTCVCASCFGSSHYRNNIARTQVVLEFCNI